MKQFDLKRFGRLLRWHVIEYHRPLVQWTLGSLLGVFLMEMFFYAVMGVYDYLHFVDSMAQFCTFFLLIASAISFCSILGGLKTKQQRMAFLALPATNAEKFLVLLVHWGIVTVACMFLAFALGDTLRMVVLAAFGGKPWTWGLPLLADNFIPNTVYCRGTLVWLALASQLTALVWIHSVYTLGGTFFRKYAFVATSALLTWFTTMGTYATVKLMGTKHLTLMSISDGYMQVHPLLWLITLTLLVLAAVHYWLSYRIFKRLQITSKNWTNA